MYIAFLSYLCLCNEKSMDNFAAIDFETANNERTSICSVGVVIVRNGEIADRFYSLVHPEPDYYLYWNTRIHGLTHRKILPMLLFFQKYGNRLPLK